jgi:hypothetical protein
VLLAAICAYAALTVATGGGAIVGAGAAGLVLVAAGIALGLPVLAHWGVGVVGATYVASLFLRQAELGQSGVLVAAALLAAAELASWSIDSRRRGRDDLTAHIHRLRGVSLLLAVGVALAAVVEGASGFGFGEAGMTGPASAAVVGGVLVTCLLAWRRAAART